ncbi:hypothetical protein CMI38_06995 [Candidatus Pacearchaeota archaeon]|jgi:hypothetical protein|nr:hypothetical protein [Candidatus Pacearchaeota archaeon]|tara:strand:- start:382 stop:567 length:186 start_codon:yes stop_codon:yes gene_type:complete
MTKNDPTKTIGSTLLIIIGFILGGTGLTILYNSTGDLASVVGGFALIGIAITIVFKIIQNG